MDIGKEQEKVTVEPIEDPVRRTPKKEPAPVREPVPAIREKVAASVATILAEAGDSEAVFLMVGIPERDWLVIVGEAKGKDVPRLRRLRRLVNQRHWRERNLESERERVRVASRTARAKVKATA